MPRSNTVRARGAVALRSVVMSYNNMRLIAQRPAAWPPRYPWRCPWQHDSGLDTHAMPASRPALAFPPSRPTRSRTPGTGQGAHRAVPRPSRDGVPRLDACLQRAVAADRWRLTDEQLAALWQAEFPNSRTRYTMKSVRTMRNLFNLGRRTRTGPGRGFPGTIPLGVRCWTCRASDSVNGRWEVKDPGQDGDHNM